MRHFSGACCAVVATVVLGSGCGTESATPAPEATDALARAAADLARLVIEPEGFTVPANGTGREASGPFDAESYLTRHSALPHADKALFSKTKLVDGYYRYLTESPRLRRAQVYLYRLRTAADATELQRSLWAQEERGPGFKVPDVPGALSETKVTKTYSPDRTSAQATVSFVSGNLMAVITVRQAAPLITDLRPDTNLAASLAEEQYGKLSSDAARANPAPAAQTG